jgi:hypothetical protein
VNGDKFASQKVELVLIKEDIVEDKDEKLRGDSFVVQKNIHYPTDANLILDGIELQ